MPAGWSLSFGALTGSTNDDARQAVLDLAEGRRVFLADGQSAGRGRYGRSWIAPHGSSLLFSVLLRTALDPIALTALCSVSIAEELQESAGLPARIKWPNDIMIGERKVCGILTEVVGGIPGTAIVGIGLNVNLDPRAAGLPPTATSVAVELGRPYPRQALFEGILARVDRALEVAPETLVPEIWARWEELLWRRRQIVRVADGGPEWEGVVEGLSPTGALLLRNADGVRVELRTAELLV